MHRFSRLIPVVGILLLTTIACRQIYIQIEEHRDRSYASNVLKMLANALQNYESTHKQLPPPTLAGHSWRIRVHPYAVSSPLYENYDFSRVWDSSENMLLDRRMLYDSKRPSEDHFGAMPFKFGASLNYPQQTRFLMIVGDRCYGTNSGVRKLAEITDGLSNTIALVETSRSDVHWLHPIDLHFDEMSFRINDGALSIGNVNNDSPLVCFCDGEVFFVDPEVPSDALKALLTIDGEEEYDRRTCIANGWLIPSK